MVAKAAEKGGNRIVSTSEMAEIFGKTPRWVNLQTNDGVFLQVGRGKYDLAVNVQRFVDQLQKQPEGDGEVNYYREKALHEAAKREKAELELAEQKGTLHRSEHVAAVMDDMLAAFRARILNLPPKLAPQLAGLADAVAIRQLLDRDVREALSELADYDPAAFRTGSRGRADPSGEV